MVLNDFIWILPEMHVNAVQHVTYNTMFHHHPLSSVWLLNNNIFVSVVNTINQNCICVANVQNKKRKQQITMYNNKHEHNRVQWNLAEKKKKKNWMCEMVRCQRQGKTLNEEKKNICFLFVSASENFWLRISTHGSHFLWPLLCFSYSYNCYDQWSSTHSQI